MMGYLQKRFRDFSADGWLLLALWLLPLLLFFDVTLGGQTMLPVDNLFQWQPWRPYAEQLNIAQPDNPLLSDLILQNYSWQQYINKSLQEGELPLWNPHLFAGAPFLANGQHSAYYPFSLLFRLMPVAMAYGWFTILQLWLAGASAYFFGRILGQRRPAALLMGVIYQGSGFLLVSAAVFPMILAAAVWLPFLLGCCYQLIRLTTEDEIGGNTLPWGVVGAIALGCQILAGHPEITYYTLLTMALYSAWQLGMIGWQQRTWRRLIKPLGWLATMVMLGLLLGAIQLFPAIMLAQTNFRQGSATFAEVQSWAFPIRHFIALIMPNFFGNPAHHSYFDLFTWQDVPFTLNSFGQPNPRGAGSSDWGIKNYVEGGIYLGILPLILALWGMRKKQTLFFSLLAFLSLNFIFGSPLYALLYYGLPFVNQLHSPFRWVFALSLCVAVLAGEGANQLLAQSKKHRPISFGLITAGGLILVGALLSRLFYPPLQPMIDRVFRGLALAPDAFASAESFFSYLFPQLVILGVVTLGTGIVWWLIGRTSRWVVVAFFLIVCDLCLANWGFHATNDPALLQFKPPVIEWLQQQGGFWRLTTFDPKGGKPLNANAGWLFDFNDVRGYDSIIDKQYTDYMSAIEPQEELPYNRVQPIKSWQAINSPLLDLLGVKYILTEESLDLPKLKEVWSADGLRVYENLAVVPHAFTLPKEAVIFAENALSLVATHDPRQTLLIEGSNHYPSVQGGQSGTLQAATVRENRRLEQLIDVDLADPSWLVLNDSYATGWKAFIRPIGTGEEAEKELPIERVNGNFRAVLIEEAGTYTVRFRYSPQSFIVGGLASFMGMIAVLFMGGVWLWRRYYRPKTALTNTQSIAKNSVVPMALNLLNKGIDFAFAAFYLRVLGPSDSGAYATAITMALWFDIVGNWGLDALIIRDVAQDRVHASRYLLNTTLLRFATMLIGLLPVGLFLAQWVASGEPLQKELLWALGLITIGMVFSSIAKGVTGLFYVFEAAEYPATLTTLTTMLKVVFGVIVLLMGWSYVGLAGVSIVVNFITLGLLCYVAFRQFPLGNDWSIDYRLQRRAFVTGFPLMLNHLLATVFFKIDQPLIARLRGNEEVGWYNSAYKWVDAFNIIPSFFTFAIFPVISRQVASDITSAERTFRMAVKILILIALPLAAVVTISAEAMIGTLGGSAFLPHGAIALQLVIWSIPIGWINSITNYTIVALGLEKQLTWGFVGGVVFNVVGNLLLIPHYGYVAAAIITIFSELILLLFFSLYLNRRLKQIGWFQLLIRPILLTAVVMVVMIAIRPIHWLLAVVVGLIVYLIGLWVLPILSKDEEQVLTSVLPFKLPSIFKK